MAALEGGRGAVVVPEGLGMLVVTPEAGPSPLGHTVGPEALGAPVRSPRVCPPASPPSPDISLSKAAPHPLPPSTSSTPPGPAPGGQDRTAKL